ncbi:MAG: glycogen debranching N-terminal domain-containing protein [Bacillota bacterium]
MKYETPPDEAIRIEDRWYVLATSARAGEPSRVLKHGESFALFDRHGDMPRASSGEHGFYHQGTRFLSRYELRLNGHRPLVLNSSVRRDNCLLIVDATNPDDFESGEARLLKGTLHFARNWILWNGACHERLEIGNYGATPVSFDLSIEFANDFVDIFEVRGLRRERRGEMLSPAIAADRVELSYRGLDGVARRTCVSWSVTPAQVNAGRADFEVTVEPHSTFEVETTIACALEGDEFPASTYFDACKRADDSLHELRERRARVTSPDEQFNAWLQRSAADIAMLMAGNPEGTYPFAGVPWFSVPFGRDAIITALEYLWADPEMAKGVLQFLASTQASESRPEQDSEPGKIVHEMRKGELAALGEIPFGRYYGTIDATPLFIVLAGEYYQRTGDIALLHQLWPHLERALEWIDRHGDVDGDGFVEYARKSGHGLVNQGWKDSEDSVFHADGSLARGAIALSEVQGYVYLARVHAARLARSLAKEDTAQGLERAASTLREKFEDAFWCEELGTYAIALDGDKRPCRVRSSNAGHLLWSGIVRPERAASVGRTLLAPDSFSGWGVRTIAKGEMRYNPMSYHNGSIWPHDNAIVAMGLARYGMKAHSLTILTGMYEASLYMDLHRLPELFCGFSRRAPGDGPTLYPVACSPQAWASAAAFYLVKACLGLSFRPQEPRIRFLHPTLPQFLDRLRLVDLRVGDAIVDVHFDRLDQEVGVKVIRKRGDVDVSIVL